MTACLLTRLVENNSFFVTNYLYSRVNYEFNLDELGVDLMVKISFESDSIDELLAQMADLVHAFSDAKKLPKSSPPLTHMPSASVAGVSAAGVVSGEKRGRGRPRKDHSVVVVATEGSNENNTDSSVPNTDGLSEKEPSVNNRLTSQLPTVPSSPLDNEPLPQPQSTLEPPAIDDEDPIKNIFKRLSKKCGIQACVQVAKEFDIKSISRLPKTQHDAFINRCTELLDKK